MTPEQFIRSVATILGWINLPPLEILEREIVMLRKMAEEKE